MREPAPEPDYTITVSREEIEKQRGLSEAYGKDRLSGYAILRKLAMSFLRDERIMLIHGSVVAYCDSAFLFTAPSGTGKTTHSRLWKEHLPDAYILNGDKPFISTGEKILAWGSPWCGSERYNRNTGVELKSICFLVRAGKNRIVEISDDEAIPMLAQQTGDPDSEDYRTKIWMVEGLNRLRGRVKFYRYEMNNYAEDAFHTTYDVLSKL